MPIVNQTSLAPSPQPPTPDLIIVGGGAAGAALGVQLARTGRKVVLCEARTFDKPKLADLKTGEVASPGAQRELARLGLPADNAVWRLDDFTALRQFWTPTRTTRHALPGGLRYWQLDRRLFDKALLDFAAQNGVDVCLGYKVTGVVRSEKDNAICGIRLSDVGGDCNPELFAPVIVDASGRNSPLIARLGMKQPETEFRRFAVVCFFSDVPNTIPGEWEQHFLGVGNTTLNGSRMSDGLYRFTLETDMVLREKFADLRRPLDIFLAILAHVRPVLAHRFRAATPLEYATAFAPVGYRVAPLILPGFLTVGDAAGYLDPATGQGIEFALRTARLAAAAIEAALARGSFTPADFVGYECGMNREVARLKRGLRLYLRATRQRWLLDTVGRVRPVRSLILRRMVKGD
jgi:flavin-dependent dehydrogenase